MTVTAALELKWLSNATMEPYQALLPEGTGSQLQIQGEPRRWQEAGRHALAINLLGLPLGLILMQTKGPPWSRNAEVISLVVAERFRRRGLGRQLLESARQSLANAGCRQLQLAYPQREEVEAAMVRLCAPERGWRPAGNTVLYSCSTAEVPSFVASLKPVELRLKAGVQLTCINYGDLSERQFRQARQHLKPPDWAKPPQPGRPSECWGELDATISQGLLLNDALVGWCLCHRIASKSHRITVAYVGEAYQRKGWMVIPVLKTVEALATWNAQTGNNPEHGIRFGVRGDNKEMIEFAERRIKPYARKTTLSLDQITALP